MKILKHLSFFAPMLLVPSAFGGDILMVVEGRVSSIDGMGLVGGPFTGVGVNDPVRLTTEFNLPSQGGGATEAFYTANGSETGLVIGASSDQGSNGVTSFFTLGNDAVFPSFPQVDYLVGALPFSGGTLLSITIEDPVGMMFSSLDLSQLIGGYIGLGASMMQLNQSGTQDGLTITIDTFSFVELDQVGTPYCMPTVPNSTGQFGRVDAFGTTQVQENRLEIQASQLPAGEFGLLIASQTQGFVANPGGSLGNLCLGGAIGRYNTLAQQSDALGEIRLDLDWNSMPQPTGSVVAIAGQTWNFQVWHRDLNPGQSTNLTGALSILLQ